MTRHITWTLVVLAAVAAIGVSACQPKGDNKESVSQSSTEQQPMSSSSSDTMKQSSSDNDSGSKDGMSK
jgi:hypothetical protein